MFFFNKVLEICEFKQVLLAQNSFSYSKYEFDSMRIINKLNIETKCKNIVQKHDS